MPKIEPIFLHGMGELGIDENNRLYWNKSPIVTKADISFIWWVNIAIVIGAISTMVLACISLFNYLGVKIQNVSLPELSWGKIFVIFGVFCLIAGPVFKERSRVIKDKNGRKGVVPYIQKKWLHKIGWLLIVAGIVFTIFGSIS